jgi:hypothetical protein
MRRLLAVAALLIACVWSGSPGVAEAASPGASVAGPAGSVRVDFDNDGFQDLAVGTPAETVGNVGFAGVVHVLYGTASGLSGAGSQLFTQDVAGIPSSVEIDDLFGGALVAGDFDGDGFQDLAVGAPGEDVGAVDAAGVVIVIYGSAGGLVAPGSQLFTQDTPGIGSAAEAFDNFGGALATGDADEDGVTDLAVGAPFEDAGAVDGAGAVNVLFGSTGGLTASGSQLFTQDVAGIGSSAEQDDGFGGALAFGEFDADGAADLAIGVSGEAVGSVQFAGAVNVLSGSPGGLVAAGSQLFTQDTAGIGSSAEPFDFFGSELASGDFQADGVVDLAVGVSGEAVGSVQFAGAVNVLSGSPGGLVAAGSQLFTQDSPGIGSTAEDSDRFGASLATGDFDADGVADLAVGAPAESVGAVVGAGAVNVLYGSGAGLTGSGSQLFVQNSAGIGSTSEETDLFGASLAAGDFDGDGPADLAVGVSQESVGSVEAAGAINILYGSGTGLSGAGSQLFTQDTAGVGSAAEAFDLFASALAVSPVG